MKNNKGITIISLIIVVIIMILLASITAYEASSIVNTAKVQSVTTNLLLIQAQIRIINEKVVFENEDEKKQELLLGTPLSNNDSMINTMENKGIITDSDDIENYYILSQENLTEMGLETLKDSDGYVVNYETEEVIYVYGVKNSEGKYLYKLSEMNTQN